MRKRAGLVACCALFLGGCAGSGAPAAPSSPEGSTVSLAAATKPPPLPVAARTAIIGGSAAQRRLLRSVMRNFGPSEITRITLARAPRERGAPAGTVLITLRTVGGADPKQQDLLGEWEGWIVGAAFRDRSERAGLPRVFLEQTAEGLYQIGDRASARPYRGPSSARVLGQIRAAVRRSGARPVTLQVGDPLGASALVRIQTTRAAAWFLARRLPAIVTATADRFTYDGLYLAVYDRTGRLIFHMANGSRMEIGADGVAVRRLVGCDPISEITPLGYQPPPCPVTPVAPAQ